MRTIRSLVGGVVLPLVLLVSGAWFPARPPRPAIALMPPETRTPQSDADALRELAERLLGEGSGISVILTQLGGGRSAPPPAPRAHILVGQLPERLPFELPIPAEARLLGSVT